MEKEKQEGFVASGDAGIIVKTGEFKGAFCVDVRKYYRDWDVVDYQTFSEKQLRNEVVLDGLKPTPKGILLKKEQFIEVMADVLIPLYEKMTKVKE